MVEPRLERAAIAFDQLRFGAVRRRVEAIHEPRREAKDERAIGGNRRTDHDTEAVCFFAYVVST